MRQVQPPDAVALLGVTVTVPTVANFSSSYLMASTVPSRSVATLI